jgi:predicted aldo/keto reductase-like oxidoreductase
METSLKRLQTDHVDLVLLHGVDSAEMVLNENIMGIFDSFRKKGMTKYVGVSTHANHEVVLDAAVKSKFWESVLVGYNYMSPVKVRKAIERTRKAGLGIIAMKNLLNPIDLKTWNWEKITDIRGGQDKKDMTPTQALIKWVIEDPNVDTAIPGMTSFEQLQEDIAVMGMNLKVGKRTSGIREIENRFGSSYCRGVAGCTGCMNQCPWGVKVSDVNRCLRYAYAYGDMDLAYENYSRIPKSSRVDRCTNCPTCLVRCVNGIDVDTMICEARKLFL